MSNRALLWPAIAGLLSMISCNDNGQSPQDAGPSDQQVAVDADAHVDGSCPVSVEPAEPTPTPKIYTPRWAFEPWISKDISDAQDTYDFVDGFASRDIPVGAVVIDSPWETNYNTFVPNEDRYPDFKQLVDDLHDRDIRIVMWITQMVNAASFDLEIGGDSYPDPSPNYAEGEQCGFFVNPTQKYLWWKGYGKGVDFFNTRALAWWHQQQDHVLQMGIDGWKLDFGDSYIDTTEIVTAKGTIGHQEYSEEYYRDFWAYGVQQRGQEFVTMVRGYDKSYQFEGRFFARPEHAPVVWAGDNRRDWIGLADALDHMFRSARAGYVVVGSDIGGYLDLDDQTGDDVPFDQENFARWVAVGGLSPFMQLHGRGNLTPWTVSPRTDETVALYRYWSWLHHEMVPFWYSLAQEAYAGGEGIVRPVGEPADWPGDYRYELGQALLVAPLLDGTGKRDVTLPSGAKWYDWWNLPLDAIQGGTTIADYDASDQQRIPLFVRAGAIIPLQVSSDVTGMGTAASAGHLTVLVFPAATRSSFRLHETDGQVTLIEAQLNGSTTQIELSRARRPVILRVHADVPPAVVKVGGVELPALSSMTELESSTSGFFLDLIIKGVWIKLEQDPSTVTVTIQP